MDGNNKLITADYEHRSDLADGMMNGSVEGGHDHYDQDGGMMTNEILVMDQELSGDEEPLEPNINSANNSDNLLGVNHTNNGNANSGKKNH
jgi:hypothetical protein